MSLEGCWMGHDDDNLVTWLYVPDYDTVKGEIRELVKVLRTGRTVRRIADDSIRYHLGETPLSEAQMLQLTLPPVYSLDEGSATSIATRLVKARRSAAEREERA